MFFLQIGQHLRISQIQSIRDAGDSNINNNQIKTVYIENGGSGVYTTGTYDIKGDGSGAKVNIEVNSAGNITKATVVSGGSDILLE